MTAKAPATGVSEKAGLYGGLVLGLSAIAALIVANSPLGPEYEALLRTTGEVRIGSIGLSKTVDHWINDGLMAVFFLLVGLEIKREVLEGELSSAAQAALPVDRRARRHGRAGGDLCRGELGRRPTRCAAGRSRRRPTSPLRSASALLGTRVPASLKIFLLALAIIDDLGGHHRSSRSSNRGPFAPGAARLARLASLALAGPQPARCAQPSPYLLVGVVHLGLRAQSGVHATLAGVAVGFAMPLTRHDGHSRWTIPSTRSGRG